MSIEDILIGARFLRRLPSFLRHPIGPEEARAILRQRLDRRETDFLRLVRRAIYEHAGSLYRELLALAGCEYGDLEKLVRQEGVEGALRILYRQGVYLTLDEFKGRRPVVRSGATITVNPSRLRNPCSTAHLPAQTSGSRGARTPVPIDLAFIRDRAVDTCLAFAARGGTGWLQANWGVPGTAAMAQLLQFSGFGAPVVRWFSQVDPAAAGLHPRYRWSALVLRWGGLLASVRLPSPVYVSLNDPLPIAHWMAQVLRAGGVPHLYTYASSAVCLCQAALDGGIDLCGAQLTVGGEPVTTARLGVIRRAGAEALPRYANTECGLIGFGCLAPDATDDVHLLHDLQALVQADANGEAGGLPASALLISTLRLTAPLILLNVSLGDRAVVVRRACGCPLERLGWATHLHTIRSFEKLTGAGMTFLDTDVIRVLEEVLPARFGGVPTDYQLVEEEAEDGQPSLRLLVHPRLGPLDTAAVAAAFLNAIGAGSGAERVMGLLWREAGLLHVERHPPMITASGKIQHFHVERRTPSASPFQAAR